MRDFELHVMELALHFQRREYPMELIFEAAMLARGLDRDELLSKVKDPNKESDKDNVFLTTTFHPSDHSLREIVHKNWDILGQSVQTENLYQKRLMMGYRRPKNLRDLLVHAGTPRQEGDDMSDPHVVETPQAPLITVDTAITVITVKQSNITDYFRTDSLPRTSQGTNQTTPVASTSNTTNARPNTRMGTAPKHRGFSFCKLKHCRICPLLNKTGEITSSTTGRTHACMKNISCRSSNLIYGITCTRCGIQYVGQTMLRVKDRFADHWGSIMNAQTHKTVGRHFSKPCHNGTKDLEISVLEFIRKAPRSPASVEIRNRVERRWMNLLRTCAPQGLNIDD